jgi:hypothetical protein
MSEKLLFYRYLSEIQLKSFALKNVDEQTQEQFSDNHARSLACRK